jgi:predicted amidophosphoribosyltransferase
VRRRDTAPQSSLAAAARRANVSDAFEADAELLRGRHVAIVDDVVTTGHTVQAMARALRRAGARRIEVWAVARAIAHG